MTEGARAEPTAARRPPRAGLAALACAIAILGVAWAGRASEGRRALAAANAALAGGDRAEAILQARAAAEARCPACSAPDAGYAKLESIAAEAEARADAATAVAAWRAVRAASLATTVFDRTTPRRVLADAQIARIEHRIDVTAAAAGAAGGTPSPAASEERLRDALQASPLPGAAVFVLVAVGGALFLAFALRFSRAHAFRAGDLAMAIAGGAIAAAGAALF